MQHNKLYIAERKVLSYCLKDDAGTSDVFHRFSCIPFQDNRHKEIFNRLWLINQNMQQYNVDILIDDLELNGKLENAGGKKYINDLTKEDVVQLEKYLSIIEDYKERRNLTYRVKEIEKMITDPDVSFEDINSKMYSSVIQNRKKNSSHIFRSDEDHKSIAKRFKQYDDDSMSVHMPWLSVDEIVGPMKPGNIVLVGAGTGVGKSTFAGEAARRLATEGLHVGYWTGEMETEEVLNRMMMANYHERYDCLPGNPTENNTRNNMIANLTDQLGNRLNINNERGITVQKLTNWFKTLKTGLPKERWVFIVDYFHLLDTSDKSPSERELYMNNIRYLSSQAQNPQVPIINLVQLGRPSEERGPYSVPRISDIYGTSELAKTAHIILFLQQPDAQSKDKRVISVQKNRNGKAGDQIEMGFIPECTRFIDEKELARKEEINKAA